MLIKITLELSFGRYTATARDEDKITLASDRRSTLKQAKAEILAKIAEEVGPDFDYEWLDLTGADDE